MLASGKLTVDPILQKVAAVSCGIHQGTPVLDLNRLMTAADGWRGMLSDGLHPNGNGGEFIHAALLEAVRAHFPELRLVATALGDDEHVRRTRELNDTGARTLTESIERLGGRVWPTDANYVLAEVPGDALYDRLLQKGVIVRPMAGFGLPQHLRISIGTAEENERFVKAVERIKGAES